MEDEELLRYSRQIMLPDIDIAGQEKLRDATVLVVGLGGLGSPAALYLAACGVGSLVLCDFDTVDLSNLQRQIVHSDARIGTNKAESAKIQLEQINPHTNITTITERLDEKGLSTAILDADLVLDCTDNFTTRFTINAACWAAHKPLVSGAAIGWEGHISVFDRNQSGSPCYQCLYQEGDDTNLNCAENGVIAPLVGIIGTTQAMEAVKVLTGVGESLIGRVLYLDAKYMEWRSLKLKPNAACPCCGGSA